jgi:hypothetical protein
LIDDGAEGDALLEALKDGPIKPSMSGSSWKVDLDRVERAR